MVIAKNKMIYQIYLDHSDWTLQMIADLTGVTRQRVSQIVKRCQKSVILLSMEKANSKYPRITKPMSLSEVSILTGIPTSSIGMWVNRGQVKVHTPTDRPKACTGHPVLLDPISLQERIDRYKPHQKKTPNN